MALTHEELQKRRRTVDVDFEGQRIRVTYDPTLVTLRWIRTPQKVDEGLAQLLVTWDYTRDGEPVPHDQESLLDIEWPLLNAVWRAIMEDIHDPQRAAS